MTAKIRCAIYTRKSSEEGLDQSFNSLHAQREACEAYVLSQAGEGWIASKTVYDDGGFSGGSMDRPALADLLRDIDAGLVDVVVVYKVDRLTRSLTDFAKIVDTFDRRNVSFVSVTQAFNTTTSMGRLTLNVLLSFAQFEREVTGERIRDKIAASKARGMWMGGMVPLGYDLRDRELHVNDAEAAVVRRIFDRYLALRSARLVVEELDRDGIRTKRHVTSAGKAVGGERFGRGGVFHILQSRLYLGEIVHKGASYPGKHPPIISPEVFQGVAELLGRQAADRGHRRARAARAQLVGKLFDPDGEPMTPTFSYGRNGRLYRYYATRDGNGRKAAPDTIRRISVPAIEGLLETELQRLLGRAITQEELPSVISRVDLRVDDTLVTLDVATAGGGQPLELLQSDIAGRLTPSEKLFAAAGDLIVLLPRRLKLRGGRKRILGVAGQEASPRSVSALKEALRRSHRLLVEHELAPSAAGANARAPASQYLRGLVTLAFLAPALQSRILDGSIPDCSNLANIGRRPPPLAWADQLAWFETLA